MTKQYKALIKLLGIIAGHLNVIAANITYSNVIKTETGVNRANVLKQIARMMSDKNSLIDKIVKEATDE